MLDFENFTAYILLFIILWLHDFPVVLYVNLIWVATVLLLLRLL